MLPLNTEVNSILFQPWQPDTSSGKSQIPTVAHQPEYIELPGVHCYEELETHAAFPGIKTRFLNDIQAMKQLVHPYVNDQYDTSIDIFHDKLKSPPEHLKNSLLPLYRETRFQIRQLVMQLKDQQNDPNVDNQNYIACVLHECLNDIQECAPGIHGRFTRSFLNLEASRGGLDGKLFKVRSELFDQFIQSFLLELQREGLVNISPNTEIHWVHSFHNLFCEPLGLSPFTDTLAPNNLSDGLTQRFLAAAPLSVNACTILRKLSSEWSDQISTTLQKLGVQAWETDVIDPSELTSDRIGTLESTLFKPVNHLLKTTGEQSLDLRALIEETGNDNYYLGRYREKLLAWVASYFSESSAQVFTAIPAGVDSAWHIGTINQLFFWVFNHYQYLPAGQACTLNANNHTTLTLPHLTSIDFSTWPQTTIYALLTQAMEQTDKAEHIASFFLQHVTIKQLGKAPAMVTRALSNQLCDKLIKNDDTFKEKLCQCVSDHFAAGTITIAPGILDWLTDTPLLKPVLLRLQQQGIHISPITSRIASWQISDFSHEDIIKLLTPNDCRRLFKQALKLKQAEILSNLLSTSHCDQLTRLLNGEDSPLACFALSGNLPGLEYLLKLGNPEVNQKNTLGYYPLHIAAKCGHTAFVRTLLTVKGIDVNAKSDGGWTPLACAVKQGHVECAKALLTADGIDVNAKSDSGWTPLAGAALKGNAECVKLLLTVKGIDVNVQMSQGFTPLHWAAEKGHTECVKVLLTANGIDVNAKSKNGYTPLIRAAQSGHAGCVTELLTAEGIDVNVKSSSGLTALHWAALYGHAHCITALLPAENIDVNVKSYDGWTPLIFAAKSGHTDCVRVLLATKGINVNATVKGYTPLHWAAINGHTECIILLLTAKGIDVNMKTPETPLHWAAINGHAGCITALLTAEDIDVNLTSIRGITPLHRAAHRGQIECVKALLKAPGIDVKIKNARGRTPRDTAHRYGHAECARLLI
ncbi:ankyrin repeat domain-containing protein [Salinisphaera sp. G21_0]|uniref:ankyrin repeat domain-containing protein n=1 Tax=Salinisphaera sp. G21_0 TaxID=2821094 RepID=UPI001ADB32C5|nr:ankyrin repeat domain-containing protein [Salinisphaera sp. G21_0]MBO9482434.1 ankyrin repeat domain-containing protein [Salinisphaera sp. G21_0]